MSIPLFFAMTDQEIHQCSSMPGRTAWMACHFASGGAGLANTPSHLPPNSMLILDDRIPFQQHNTQLICKQIQDLVHRLEISCVLLDFERPPADAIKAMARDLVRCLSCPVGVPPGYAQNLDCAVFLPPVPPHISPEEYLRPYGDREIWLEMALDGSVATITEKGCVCTSMPFPERPSCSHYEPELLSHYQIQIESGQIRFSFHRTETDLEILHNEVEKLGVTTAIGLYQELFRN